MSDKLIHSFFHAVEHTLPIIPFLFLTYFFMELLEHRAGDKMNALVMRSGKAGHLVGALLGTIPQCGFSAVGAGLYSRRLITTGALISIFLSTSDEMLPLLISSGISLAKIVKRLGCKIVIAIFAGVFTDLLISLKNKKGIHENGAVDICESGHCHCHCENRGLLGAALIHTLQIILSVLAISFAINFTLELLGEDFLTDVMNSAPVLSCIISALVGLLPNCASSVAITQLYLQGVLPIGAMLSGLLVNAGIGMLILLRANKPIGDSLRVIGILLATGIIFGTLFDVTPLGAVLGL